MSLGDKLNPIMTELETTILEHEVYVQTPIRYSNDAFRAITKIFMSAMLDKMWLLQQEEGVNFKTRCEMATKCGEDLRKFVNTYTGIDTHKLYENGA